METHITLYWLVGGVLLASVASLGDRLRRHRPLAWHAHLPWHAVIFTGAGMALFAAVHLFTLVRASTG